MAILLALLLDAACGEPPSRLHPVVWMGHFLSWGSRRIPAAPRVAFRRGAGLWLLGLLACLAVGILLEWLLSPLGLWGIPLKAFLLWPLFSARLLQEEVGAVETSLLRSLEEGRERLARIVSRDVSELSEAQVRESALESLSENLTDSVIAPLFWFLLLGLPGAIAYRFANTADAMWGYRDHREWFGKLAARADDVLNWIPARLTGLLLCPWQLWERLSEEARRTPSPNGGWTMGALALRLGIRLEKPGVYVLNPEGRLPGPREVAQGLLTVRRVIWISGAVLAVFEWCLHRA